MTVLCEQLELSLEVFSSLNDSVKCFLVHSRGFTADTGIFCVPLAEEGEVKGAAALRRDREVSLKTQTGDC